MNERKWVKIQNAFGCAPLEVELRTLSEGLAFKVGANAISPRMAERRIVVVRRR
jgi:hypothetical protein